MTTPILQLSNDNATSLEALAPDVFDHPIDPVQLRNFLNDPRHMMVVAIEDGLVVGMASGVEYFHPDKPPQLWINEVGVSPAYRRRGIGRRLIAALAALAKKRGGVYAWLGTDKENDAAQACFASVPDAEPAQDVLLYAWDLED